MANKGWKQGEKFTDFCRKQVRGDGSIEEDAGMERRGSKYSSNRRVRLW